MTIDIDQKTLVICTEFTRADKHYSTRQLAQELGYDKSTIFYHLKCRAPYMCPHLVEEISNRLQTNKEEAPSRGGVARHNSRRKKKDE